MYNLLNTDLDPLHSVEVAKGISDFGFMAITTAFYLIVTGIIIVFFVRWFVKIINDIVTRQEKTLDEIVNLQHDMVATIGSINDALKDNTFQQARQFGKSVIENCKYELYFDVIKVKNDNGIDDKERIVKKVYSLVQNVHDNRSNLFELSSYRGKKLTAYSESNWVEKVSTALIDWIYSGQSENRLMDNLSIVFTEILNEFFKNLAR